MAVPLYDDLLWIKHFLRDSVLKMVGSKQGTPDMPFAAEGIDIF